MSRKILLAPLTLALALTLSCGFTTDDGSETVQAAGDVGDREPAYEFDLEDMDGRRVKLSDFKGDVVLLNFWATWCGPCKIEMPWFVDFQREYKGKGFSVVAVSLDEEGWEIVRPFVDEMKLNFPVLLGDDDMADRYGGIAALPTTFIIDREGRIFSKHTGLVSKGDYESEIESLL